MMKLLFALTLVTPTAAYPQFATRIPNGISVPNPGPQGGVWAGVGHQNAAGGGERNSFGLEFAANDFQWTMALCQSDSDGDGRSNGEELGDPECKWVEGEEPSGPALSHPGIADEPRDAMTLSTCEDYVSPDDEITMDITFSVPTEMDETQTHYICEQKVMDVPSKSLLHKIKHEIILDNSDVLHHMFVYICPADTNSTDGDRVGDGAYQCSGNESRCQRVGGWAVGPHQRCNPPNVGDELDFSDTDRIVVKIEAHYDNTLGEPQKDQSGIRLFMTSTLRPLVGGEVVTGFAPRDASFLIPAGQDGYPLTNICPTAITEHMDHPVYAYSFTPHMHLYGKALVTEHYRCGEKIGELGRISAYEFDNQQTYIIDPPVKILPGDSLVTTCAYDTSQVDFDVLGGEETTDEMCLNFVSVYPRAGTEQVPSILSPCMVFEQGFRRMDGQLVPARVALGDSDRITMTTDFISDPESSIGSCCAANNCEELHLAEANEACAVDSDCTSGLICVEGMCEFSPENQLPQEDDDSTSGAMQWEVSTMFLVPAAVLFLWSFEIMDIN